MPGQLTIDSGDTAWMLVSTVLVLLMLIPALVSNDRAMRALKAGWKRIQRLAYAAAILTLVHWALIHDGLVPALANFAPLLVLQLIRLIRFLNLQRSTT